MLKTVQMRKYVNIVEEKPDLLDNEENTLEEDNVLIEDLV